MTRTILLVAGLTVALLAAPMTAGAQEAGKVARVGILSGGSPASHGQNFDWLHQGLGDLGYVEGWNFVFVHRWAMGKRKQLPALAKELVRAKVDVIVVNGGTSIKAALTATRTVPIVVGSSGNLARYVASLAKPGGNITGSTFNVSALNGKRLGLLREALPSARRVAFLFYPLRRALRDLKRIESANKTLGFKVQPLKVQTPGDIEGAFASMVNARADALMINLSSFTISHQKRLTALAIKNKMPTMCDLALFAQAGCLMSYSADRKHMMRRAAAFIDKILKGANPGDLPVELASRYKLVVNLKTAKALGLKLPPSIFVQATEVIE